MVNCVVINCNNYTGRKHFVKKTLERKCSASRNILATSSPVSERKEDEPIRKALIEEAMSFYGRSKEERSSSEAIEERIAEADDTTQLSQILLNKEVQTEVEIECARELKIISLEAEVCRLKAACKRYLKRCQSQKSEQGQIKTIFTPVQLKKLRAPSKSHPGTARTSLQQYHCILQAHGAIDF